jgi:DNA-binding protein H-NS
MMSAKKIEFESMSLDDLWSLHEEISTILSARIKAEKQELEKRLAVLSGGLAGFGESNHSRSLQDGKPRRKYPRVLPKYRNPQTFETWSGRGKRPRWLVAAMKSGRKMEEFRIGEGGAKADREPDPGRKFSKRGRSSPLMAAGDSLTKTR